MSARKRKAAPENNDDTPILHKRPRKVEEWTVEHVQSFLVDKGFEEYVEAAEENEIDGEALLVLEAKELKEELGMTNLKRRKALLADIEELSTGIDSHTRPPKQHTRPPTQELSTGTDSHTRLHAAGKFVASRIDADSQLKLKDCIEKAKRYGSQLKLKDCIEKAKRYGPPLVGTAIALLLIILCCTVPVDIESHVSTKVYQNVAECVERVKVQSREEVQAHKSDPGTAVAIEVLGNAFPEWAAWAEEKAWVVVDAGLQGVLLTVNATLTFTQNDAFQHYNFGIGTVSIMNEALSAQVSTVFDLQIKNPQDGTSQERVQEDVIVRKLLDIVKKARCDNVVISSVYLGMANDFWRMGTLWELNWEKIFNLPNTKVKKE